MKKKFRVTVDDETFIVEVEEVVEEGKAPNTDVEKLPQPARTVLRRLEKPEGRVEAGVVTAPIPGVVLDVRVSERDRVEAGSVLLVLEAMKMENEIYSPSDGVVKKMYVKVGQQVNRGDDLVLVS